MHLRRRSLCCFMLTLASAGCSVSIAPIDVASGCPEQPARTPARSEAAAEADAMIDDFEHEGVSLPRHGGRDGVWAMGSDGTADELEAKLSDHCAARGQGAGHFVGNGFSGWGATWTALLRNPAGGMGTEYDATAYGGVSFWAALSPEAPAPFSLPVGVTNPAPDAAAGGVGCPRCLDYYSSEVVLDHTWRRFALRFSDLTQLNNGNPLVPVRLDELVGVTFWPAGDFDIWIDDVRFEP
jgi:hypothetical protein